uniref:Reverse transcriptase domain-containing protein n=1 Tax=Cannabis sativa TaxID=3483 RepID=A0A803P2Y2_CANSA
MASSSGVGGREDVFSFQIEEEDLAELPVGQEGEEEGIDDRWCLVGRFLSNRMIDFDKMQNILASLWQPGMGMFVKKLEDNRFLFQFYHEVDIQRVINGSPRTFDRIQLIIERLPVGGDPTSLQLNHLDIWVQIHDVKPGCMKETTEAIKEKTKLTHENGSWFWVHFKYERVPTFCFICGVIGHSDKFCSRLFQQPIDQITKPYGEFMIATPQRSYKNIGARWLRNRGWSPAANSGDNAPGHSSNQTNMETNPPVGVATSHGQGILHKNGKNHAMINDMMEGDLEGDFASNKDGEVNVSKNGNNKEKGIVIGGNSEVTIYDNKKRKGGRAYPTWLLDGFQDTVRHCGLCDLDLLGHKFTWEKSRDTPAWIEARLDRAMVNFLWLTRYPEAKLFNLAVSPSDHSPLFLDMLQHVKPAGVNFFRFKNYWTRLEESRIKQCNNDLKLLKGRCDTEGKQRYSDTKLQLFETLNQKEIYWHQRSKQLWLKDGDRNNDMGELKYWDAGLGELMLDYYSKMFSAEPGNWEEVLSCVVPKVDEEQNNFLVRPIETQEVKDALFQMHPDKSLGPNGMNPKFFQKYWHIVGADVVACVQNFFMTEEMPVGLNDTNIVLIPKKKKPDDMSELRPISLCNVVAKVITKVLANRLKGLLPGIISLNQSAFIPGRLITDNIMVSYEVLHYLKRKQVGRDGCMALKLDLSKAYDRVDWNFLTAMLSRLGFSEKWVRLVYGCLSSVQYNIVSSGYTIGPIIPTRGLRQGDPISPYLFLICAEGLSALIQRYEERKLIHGCKVANGAPVVSHMLFADDCFLYCKATEREVTNVQQMLQIFANASGQRVNFGKSSAFFSSNTTSHMKATICDRLGIREAEENSKYLGLPSSIGRNKTAAFSFVVDKVQKRIQSWDNKFLSRAGKEVLIKAVVQALPAYTMNLFLLPVGTCQAIESAISRFWWKSNSTKGIHWLCWDKLTAHKSNGGSNPSYIWRSVLEAQGLVRAGARRLIGDGSQDVISDVLNDRDQQLVWRIPLWYWVKDSKGMFSVKSAYRHQQEAHGHINLNVPTDMWKRLWNLKVPPKVLNFLWRVSANCLPTRFLLALRHVQVDSLCPFCSAAPETALHVLVRCNFAKLCWQQAKVPTVAPAAMFFRSWFEEGLSKWNEVESIEAAMTLWALWKVRNDVVWNSISPTSEEVIHVAKMNYSDWCKAQQFEKDALHGHSMVVSEKWCPPSFPSIKVNVDGAIFASEGRFGVGMVARSAAGLVLQAKTLLKTGLLQPHEVEAFGIKEALSWIKSNSWEGVILESDCLRVISDVQSNKSMVSPYGHIILDCKALCAEIENISFSFVKRSANRVAHCLGRSSLLEADRTFNSLSLPFVIASLVSEDLN